MNVQLINDSIWTAINLLLLVAFTTGFIYLFVLLVKALKKYISSAPVRTEKKEMIQSLGETLKQYRTTNKMTQEFVAEAIGVSRQAVSKWESGKADPSTSNLMALAKLYKIEPELLIRCMTKE